MFLFVTKIMHLEFKTEESAREIKTKGEIMYCSELFLVLPNGSDSELENNQFLRNTCREWA